MLFKIPSPFFTPRQPTVACFFLPIVLFHKPSSRFNRKSPVHRPSHHHRSTIHRNVTNCLGLLVIYFTAILQFILLSWIVSGSSYFTSLPPHLSFHCHESFRCPKSPHKILSVCITITIHVRLFVIHLATTPPFFLPSQIMLGFLHFNSQQLHRLSHAPKSSAALYSSHHHLPTVDPTVKSHLQLFTKHLKNFSPSFSLLKIV